MSKKNKLPIEQIDYQIGVGLVIPSTQEAFNNKKDFSANVRKEEGQNLKKFKEVLGTQIENYILVNSQFPSKHEFFVFIIQYFASEKDYRSRDIDNMAKTILDVLKDRFYKDDSQVKTLLVGKKIEKRVPQNFAYLALKEIKDGRDIDVLKVSGLERSITLFNDLKKQGVC